MSHITNEEIVLAYWNEPDSAGARKHLEQCAHCREELARLASVLDQVKPEEIAEPPEGWEAQVWSRLQWRLRGERKNRRTRIAGWAAAAAAVVLAFVAGLLWNRRPAVTPEAIATQAPAAAAKAEEQQRERILLVVVGDHFEQSERVLVELTNLPPGEEVDITSERERAEALLASNRIYRRSAQESGEESVATLLDELEPVLLQIARSDEHLTGTELRSIQRRVEARGLVFKLRVVRAGVRSAPQPVAAVNHGII